MFIRFFSDQTGYRRHCRYLKPILHTGNNVERQKLLSNSSRLYHYFFINFNFQMRYS